MIRTPDRRTFMIGGLAAMVCAVASCAAAPPSSPLPESSTNPSPDAAPSPGPGNASAKRVLLVFFSRAGENYYYGDRITLEVGNTAVLAEMIRERIDCDVHEIRAAQPYPEAYEPTVARNSQEQAGDERPGIADPLPAVQDYDTILLGSPVWNTSAPKIMSTFIESVELGGKTILPFATYAVSGMSGIDNEYRAALPGSVVRDGLAVQGETVSEAAGDLEAWLEANDLL